MSNLAKATYIETSRTGLIEKADGTQLTIRNVSIEQFRRLVKQHDVTVRERGDAAVEFFRR